MFWIEIDMRELVVVCRNCKHS